MGKVIAEGGRVEVSELASRPNRTRRPLPSRSQRRLSTIMLLTVDVLMFAVGILAARWFAHSYFGLPSGLFFGKSFPVVFEILAIYLAIYWAYGLYNTSQLSSGGSDYRAVGNANAIGLVASILLAGYVTHWTLDAKTIVPFWFCTTCATLLGRFAMRRFVFSQRNHGKPVERTLILGANSEGIAMAGQLSQSPRSGSTVIGFLDDMMVGGEEPVPSVPILGRLDDLEHTIQDECVDSVLIASPSLLTEFFEREERALEILSHVEVQMAWGGFDLLATGIRTKEEGSVSLVVLNKTRIRGVHLVLKTIMDYTLAIVALILLFPLFVYLWIRVKRDSPGPVIHLREVVGVNGKRFYAYKFRTMYQNADEMMTDELREEWRVHGKIKDDPRITKAGAMLRKFSFDELPQLFNVLRGEMSLVGPRMITQGELQRFGRWQHSRNLVKPGLTGLWQVSGRSDLSYEDRARLDIFYIRNHSIWLDLKILLKTIPAVISGRGAS